MNDPESPVQLPSLSFRNLYKKAKGKKTNVKSIKNKTLESFQKKIQNSGKYLPFFRHKSSIESKF